VTTIVVSNLPRRQERNKRLSVQVENFFFCTQQGIEGLKIYTPNQKGLLSTAE
jgi:hypothetical protein